MMRIDRLLHDLQSLAGFGATGSGIDRPAFSDSYREAASWLVNTMQQAGLRVREDQAGNVIGRMGPAAGPAVVAGSHIDSVPGGGIYDGTLGVLTAIEVARCLREQRKTLQQAFEVIAFADEEGAYLGELGCRAMTGGLGYAEVTGARSRRGELLIDALRRYGLEPERIVEAARSPADFAAYVELHIEQGPVLEAGNTDIGIVTGIVGIDVSELTFTGQASHAGTTPVALRRDALRAAAETVTEAYRRFEAHFSADNARLNFGMLQVLPGSQNVVPASARLAREIRALDQSAIIRIRSMTQEVAAAAAQACGTSVETLSVSYDPPAKMCPAIMQLIEDSARSCGSSTMHMPSGAGHDAQVMAQVTRAGMLFVPSRLGLSHNPDEYTAEVDIQRGAEVLYRVILALTTR